MTLSEKPTHDRYLAAHHLEMLLKGSSLSQGIIDLRGYFTARTLKELEAIGFRGVREEQLPGVVIPIYGVDGDIVYYQYRPDVPRINNDGRPVKYESLPNQPPRIDVGPTPYGIDDPSIPLLITEGIKKVDSAAVRGICAIGLIGVWNWRGKNASGGSMELADWDRIAIKGRIIYIAFDSDVMVKPSVKQALRRLAGILKRRGAKEIRPIVMPHFGDGKTGIDDWFAAGRTPQELYTHVDRDLLHTDGIVCNNRGLADITADALNALVDNNIPPSVFVRDGVLCRIRETEEGLAKIEDLNPTTMRHVLARCATWVMALKDGPKEIAPPKDVVEDLLACGAWPEIPPIAGISESPILNTDGTISDSPGYSPKSRVFLASKKKWTKWEGTTEEAVKFLINDMLGDFPFVGDASLAHALALMILPIVRSIINGPTPFHLVGAPQPGMGKSLLSRICLIPTCGESIYPTGVTRDEEEWRKIITTALSEGPSYVFFDNLAHRVSSVALDAAFAGTHWKGRLLSVSRNLTAPIRCAWVGTSNNAELSPDLTRRTIYIKIDAEQEHPDERDGWRHPDIEGWTRDNRVRIVSALCHLVTEWVAAGSPRWTGRIIGSFEEWTRVIGGILTHAGVPGFLDNVDELRQSVNSDEVSWAAFYGRWNNLKEQSPTKAGELIEEFEQDEALLGLLGDKSDLSRKNKLGFLLKRRVGIVCGGFKIENLGIYQKSVHYRIVPAGGVSGELSESRGSCKQTPPGNNTSPLGSSNANSGGVGGVGGVEASFTHMRAHTLWDQPQQLPQTPPGNLQLPPNSPHNSPENGPDDEPEILI